MEDTSTTWFGKGRWFGYNYLGPGTDVKHHKFYNVQPVNALDKYAQTHDYDYNRVKEAVENGEITWDQAADLVDKADAALAWGATKDFYKGVPYVAWNVGKAAAPPGLRTAMGTGEALYEGDWKSLATGGAMKAGGLPGEVGQGISLGKAGARYAKMLPSGATGAVMWTKYGLSKLGIGRGSFAGLPKDRHAYQYGKQYRRSNVKVDPYKRRVPRLPTYNRESSRW